MGTLTGYIGSAALKGAIELDLFTAIAEGNATAEDLALRCEASPRAMRILCDYLTIHGFLTKQGMTYGLTPDSDAFLNRRSPAFMGSVAFFLASDYLKAEFRDVAALVKQGTSFDRGAGLEPEHPMWVEFARSMAPMMMLPAKLMAEAVTDANDGQIKVLDIAAGHGIYGISVALRNPNAEIVALDWRNVLEFAKENAERFGISDRFRTIPGSAFDVDLGSAYDLILIPNFLHHFEVAKNEEFLKKVRAALKPNGRAATVEFVPNEDRVSPPFAAGFSMMMLGGTPSGDAYTFPELESMFVNAGFGSTTRHDLTPTPSTLLVSQA